MNIELLKVAALKKSKNGVLVEGFSNWIDELDKEDIYEIKSLVGDFSSFTIHWRNNHNLFMFLSEINEIYSFVIDNDNWQKKINTELMKLNF